MVAVFDIGNSNIHIGLCEDRTLVRKMVFPTRDRIPEVKIDNILARHELEGVSIVSVVPRLTNQVVRLCRRHRIKPVRISSRLKCGIKYSYHNPARLGADRIASAVGALSLYDRNVIIVDAGTAITVDAITHGGKHLGGIICPGMRMLSEIMSQKTAQLPMVRVTRPVNLIGKSTEACIRSGVFNGTMAMIGGLIRAIKAQTKRDFYCLATGGSGRLIASYVDEIDEYNPDLIMYGALEIYHKHA
jgi:type III pantothenate kinase